MTDDTHAVDGPIADLGGLLVAYRMAIYLGGLAVIGFPLAWRELTGVTVPQSIRAALTVSVVSLMIVTYVAELRIDTGDDGGSDAPAGGSDPTADGSGGYPLRTRVAVAAAVIGLASGVYVALEVSIPAGVLFVAGSYLFAYLAYDRDAAAGTDTETDGGVR